MQASAVRRTAHPRIEGAGRSPLRLLHVFPSFSIGGIQRQFALMAGALGAAAEHVVVPLDGRTEAMALLPPDAVCTVLEPPSLPEDGPLARLRAIRGCLGRTGAALVLTYNWGAIEWCLANRLFGAAPGIHCEHGFGLDEVSRPLRRRSRFRRMALGSMIPLVVPSTTLMRLAVEEWGFPESQLRFVPNGVDMSALTRRTPDVTRPASADAIVIGCVAPLRPEKNLARLLRAFAAACGADPRWRLVVAGDGPELSRLEIVAQQLGVRHRVQFQGWVQDTSEFLAGVDVAALSSDTEQAPFSVLEAAAAARAIVATDVGDVRDLVSEANRPYVVVREDEDGFAAALRSLAADPGLARRVGEANREHVAARYPASRMVGALCAVMDEALVQTRSRRLVRQMLRVEPVET